VAMNEFEFDFCCLFIYFCWSFSVRLKVSNEIVTMIDARTTTRRFFPGNTTGWRPRAMTSMPFRNSLNRRKEKHRCDFRRKQRRSRAKSDSTSQPAATVLEKRWDVVVARQRRVAKVIRVIVT